MHYCALTGCVSHPRSLVPVHAIVLETNTVTDAQVVYAVLRHRLIAPVVESHSYAIRNVRPVTLFYFVPHHGAAYRASDSRYRLTAAAPHLVAEHSAHDPADDGADAYPCVARLGRLDRVNHAISVGIGL